MNNAATSLEISKSSLLKIAREHGYSGHELDRAVKGLLKARRGMGKKLVTVNEMTFESLSEAARYFGVSDRTVSYWVNQKGLNFEVNTSELEFGKLEKGSREHLTKLVERADFTTKEDW